MTFSYTVSSRDAMGHGVVFGTYTSEAGDTGGAIKTGLNKVRFFGLDTNTSSAVTRSSASNGTVTIVTADGQTGNWMAIGY